MPKTPHGPTAVLQDAEKINTSAPAGNRIPIQDSYKYYQQDATVGDNLLFPCSLTALHVSRDIIAHHQEHLNCSYSFWFPNSAMTATDDTRE